VGKPSDKSGVLAQGEPKSHGGTALASSTLKKKERIGDPSTENSGETSLAGKTPMRGQALSKHRIAVSIVGIVALSVSAAFAESHHHPFPRSLITPYLHIPPLVRFTGTLHPSEEKNGDGLHTLWISVRDKEWQFRLTAVDVLTGTNYGWMILSDIFPPHLRISAPENLLAQLERPEIVGKPLIIEGRLYRVNRVLLVTALEDASENPR
jgi:hypothetical protein